MLAAVITLYPCPGEACRPPEMNFSLSYTLPSLFHLDRVTLPSQSIADHGHFIVILQLEVLGTSSAPRERPRLGCRFSQVPERFLPLSPSPSTSVDHDNRRRRRRCRICICIFGSLIDLFLGTRSTQSHSASASCQESANFH